MALFGKIKEPTRDALHLRGIEGLHTFSVRDAEVFTTMDNENRGIPVAHELVG